MYDAYTPVRPHGQMARNFTAFVLVYFGGGHTISLIMILHNLDDE